MFYNFSPSVLKRGRNLWLNRPVWVWRPQGYGCCWTDLFDSEDLEVTDVVETDLLESEDLSRLRMWLNRPCLSLEDLGLRMWLNRPVWVWRPRGYGCGWTDLFDSEDLEVTDVVEQTCLSLKTLEVSGVVEQTCLSLKTLRLRMWLNRPAWVWRPQGYGCGSRISLCPHCMGDVHSGLARNPSACRSPTSQQRAPRQTVPHRRSLGDKLTTQILTGKCRWNYYCLV